MHILSLKNDNTWSGRIFRILQTHDMVLELKKKKVKKSSKKLKVIIQKPSNKNRATHKPDCICAIYNILTRWSFLDNIRKDLMKKKIQLHLPIKL